ncbi:MAG: DUF3098 domain-containing protein [Bacteroidia bacterium]|nr:DUF3098 domain-containing protein [Bacteroidia bacterium]MCZ2278444.1 DUF3098 domain-containing protein [Bacteroidia bacterium]
MATKTNQPTAKKQTAAKSDFSFGRINYLLMICGIGLILLGFILMSGGKSDDPNVFNPEVFSFRRITLAPIVVLSGFILNIYAILKKSKD